MAKRKVAPAFFDFVIRRTLLVESAANGVGKELTNELGKALSTVRQQIEKRKDTDTFTKTYYERAAAELSISLDKLDKTYKGVLNDSTRQMVQSEYDATTRRLRKMSGKALKQSPYTLPVKQVKSFLEEPMGGDFLDGWINRHLGAVRNTVRSEMAQAITLNETVAQASKRLQNVDGIGRKGATMIARTVFNHTSNKTRMQSYLDNPDVISAFRFLATLDSRTTYICAHNDGKTYTDADKIPKPPLHPNCRSTIIGLTDIDLAIEEEGDEELEATRPAVVSQKSRTVHHRDGTTSTQFYDKQVKQVPGGTTFVDFFKRQPESWQKSYLGKERYQLYQEGKISFADLAKNQQSVGLQALKTKAEKKEEKAIKATQTPEPAFGIKQRGKKFEEKDFDGTGLIFQDENEKKKGHRVNAWNKDFEGMDPKAFRKGLEKDIPEGYKLDRLTYTPEKNLSKKNRTHSFNIIYSKEDDSSEYIVMTRRFNFKANGEKVVEHSLFEMTDGIKGKGVGKKFLTNWFDLYEQINIDKIELDANIDVGGYAWARYGFKPSDWEGARSDIDQRIRSAKVPRTVKEELTKIIDSSDDPKTLWKLADHRRGKDILLGSEWEGVFDFQDREQLARFKAYTGWESKKDFLPVQQVKEVVIEPTDDPEELYKRMILKDRKPGPLENEFIKRKPRFNEYDFTSIEETYARSALKDGFGDHNITQDVLYDEVQKKLLSQGIDKKALDKVNTLLREHSIGGDIQKGADIEIQKIFYGADSPEKKAMTALFEAEEKAYLSYNRGKSYFYDSRDSIMRAKWDRGVKQANELGDDSDYNRLRQQALDADYDKFEDRMSRVKSFDDFWDAVKTSPYYVYDDQKVYRKGNTDKNIMSWTQRFQGATGFANPDHIMSHKEMYDQGFLPTGFLKMQGSPGEAEITLLRLKKQYEFEVPEQVKAPFQQDSKFYEKTLSKANEKLKELEKEGKLPKGLNLESYKALVKEKAQNVLNNANIYVRADYNIGMKILDEGFKTQFETGESNGMLAEDVRRRAEQSLFGTPPDQIKDRPIYGYVQDTDNLAVDPSNSPDWYGGAVFRLKSEVKKRATVAPDDTLSEFVTGEYPFSSNVDDIGMAIPISSMADVDPMTLLSQVHTSQGSRILRTGHEASKVKDLGFSESEYVEAEVHGGVKVEDIEKVIISKENSGFGSAKRLIKKLEEKGIPYEIID